MILHLHATPTNGALLLTTDDHHFKAPVSAVTTTTLLPELLAWLIKSSLLALISETSCLTSCLTAVLVQLTDLVGVVAARILLRVTNVAFPCRH